MTIRIHTMPGLRWNLRQKGQVDRRWRGQAYDSLERAESREQRAENESISASVIAYDENSRAMDGASGHSLIKTRYATYLGSAVARRTSVRGARDRDIKVFPTGHQQFILLRPVLCMFVSGQKFQPPTPYNIFTPL